MNLPRLDDIVLARTRRGCRVFLVKEGTVVPIKNGGGPKKNQSHEDFTEAFETFARPLSWGFHVPVAPNDSGLGAAGSATGTCTEVIGFMWIIWVVL